MTNNFILSRWLFSLDFYCGDFRPTQNWLFSPDVIWRFSPDPNTREANDIAYSALLPIAKRDVVKGKYQFVMLIELCGFLIMAILTVVRMTVLKDSAVYRQNALMNANPFYLAIALLIFGLFNAVFVGGFFSKAVWGNH